MTSQSWKAEGRVWLVNGGQAADQGPEGRDKPWAAGPGVLSEAGWWPPCRWVKRTRAARRSLSPGRQRPAGTGESGQACKVGRDGPSSPRPTSCHDVLGTELVGQVGIAPRAARSPLPRAARGRFAGSFPSGDSGPEQESSVCRRSLLFSPPPTALLSFL